MSEVAMIGIDLAKRVFQLHGACVDGTVAFRKIIDACPACCIYEPTTQVPCSTSDDNGPSL